MRSESGILVPKDEVEVVDRSERATLRREPKYEDPGPTSLCSGVRRPPPIEFGAASFSPGA